MNARLRLMNCQSNGNEVTNSQLQQIEEAVASEKDVSESCSTHAR